jgi:hypothetical protein
MAGSERKRGLGLTLATSWHLKHLIDKHRLVLARKDGAVRLHCGTTGRSFKLERAGDNPDLESILQSLAKDASLYEPVRSEPRDSQFQLWLARTKCDGINLAALRIMREHFFIMRKELQKLLRTIGHDAYAELVTVALADSTNSTK